MNVYSDCICQVACGGWSASIRGLLAIGDTDKISMTRLDRGLRWGRLSQLLLGHPLSPSIRTLVREMGADDAASRDMWGVMGRYARVSPNVSDLVDQLCDPGSERIFLKWLLTAAGPESRDAMAEMIPFITRMAVHVITRGGDTRPHVKMVGHSPAASGQPMVVIKLCGGRWQQGQASDVSEALVRPANIESKPSGDSSRDWKRLGAAVLNYASSALAESARTAAVAVECALTPIINGGGTKAEEVIRSDALLSASSVASLRHVMKSNIGHSVSALGCTVDPAYSATLTSRQKASATAGWFNLCLGKDIIANVTAPFKSLTDIAGALAPNQLLAGVLSSKLSEDVDLATSVVVLTAEQQLFLVCFGPRASDASRVLRACVMPEHCTLKSLDRAHLERMLQLMESNKMLARCDLRSNEVALGRRAAADCLPTLADWGTTLVKFEQLCNPTDDVTTLRVARQVQGVALGVMSEVEGSLAVDTWIAPDATLLLKGLWASWRPGSVTRFMELSRHHVIVKTMPQSKVAQVVERGLREWPNEDPAELEQAQSFEMWAVAWLLVLRGVMSGGPSALNPLLDMIKMFMQPAMVMSGPWAALSFLPGMMHGQSLATPTTWMLKGRKTLWLTVAVHLANVTFGMGRHMTWLGEIAGWVVQTANAMRGMVHHSDVRNVAELPIANSRLTQQWVSVASRTAVSLRKTLTVAVTAETGTGKTRFLPAALHRKLNKRITLAVPTRAVRDGCAHYEVLDATSGNDAAAIVVATAGHIASRLRSDQSWRSDSLFIIDEWHLHLPEQVLIASALNYDTWLLYLSASPEAGFLTDVRPPVKTEVAGIPRPCPVEFEVASAESFLSRTVEVAKEDERDGHRTLVICSTVREATDLSNTLGINGVDADTWYAGKVVPTKASTIVASQIADTGVTVAGLRSVLFRDEECVQCQGDVTLRAIRPGTVLQRAGRVGRTQPGRAIVFGQCRGPQNVCYPGVDLFLINPEFWSTLLRLPLKLQQVAVSDSHLTIPLNDWVIVRKPDRTMSDEAVVTLATLLLRAAWGDDEPARLRSMRDARAAEDLIAANQLAYDEALSATDESIKRWMSSRPFAVFVTEAHAMTPFMAAKLTSSGLEFF